MSIYIRYPTLGSGGSGVNIYPNIASFPVSAPIGTLGVASDTGIVYEFFGGSWQAIAALGDALSLGSPLNGLSLVANVLTIGLSSASSIGALSSADWTTFNSKQPAGNYITALTGDGTAAGPGSSVLTLSTVATPGTFPKIIFNAKGLVTSGTTLSAGDIPPLSYVSSVTASPPLSSSGGLTPNITISQSGVSTDGYLSSVDWNTFNNKQSTLTLGDLTDAGTDGITVTGGSGAVVGSGTSLSQHVSDTTHNGYLSSADWNTFNSKQPAGSYITALTGDVTASGPGNAATTLATVNGNVGSFGSWTSIPTITVNAKGLVTAVSGNAVIAPAGTLTGTTLNSTVVTSSLTSLGVQSQALNMGSNQINSVSDPTLAQDAATKNYVDMVASGLQPIQAVYAATTGSNIPGSYLNGVAGVGATFTTTSTSTFTLDGTTPPLLSRILIKDQSSGFQNGVYTFTALPVGGISGAVFTRSLDYDTAADINAGDLIPVINGTVNSQTSWLQTAAVTTVGTDSLVFVLWTANPANYLLKVNNLSDVSSPNTALNNILPSQTGKSGDFLTTDGTNTSWTASSPGAAQTAVFNETESAGTNGNNNGNFTSGTWNTRFLNTTQASQTWASLSSNQVTLNAGTYLISASAPAWETNNHQAKLRDITNSADLIIGSSQHNGGGAAVSQSLIQGVIVLSGTTTVEVQHQAQTTSNTNGYGLAAGFGNEIFTQLVITKQ